ncbi:MAG TPA: NAD(P)H-dependent glycerol-3-phosphate dehydrogenase [Planctomycetota bacterium]|nr:NAD(P)H-dependent glycerol-3-phosphate dehydrogenase [Planctomycetota bacterium]
MSERLVVVGAGSWGTAMALVAHAQGYRVTLWSRRAEQAAAMTRDRENSPYLPGVPLPADLEVASDPAAIEGADRVVSAVPTQHVRSTLGALKARIRPGTPVLSLSKGIEIGSLARPSEILESVLDTPRVTVLSGPSHAEEVARGLPTVVVAASKDEGEARRWQESLSSQSLRLYTGDDPVGSEFGGALKNVIAIAAGIADGLGLGDNAKAALVTRGIVEMARLGTALGARHSTFFGISGVGDLITSCTSRHGRNLRVGREVAAGRKAGDVLKGMVAEGVWTCTAARGLAKKHNLDMPITEEVYLILHEGKKPKEGLKTLMTRLPKSEAPDLA